MDKSFPPRITGGELPPIWITEWRLSYTTYTITHLKLLWIFLVTQKRELGRKPSEWDSPPVDGTTLLWVRQSVSQVYRSMTPRDRCRSLTPEVGFGNSLGMTFVHEARDHQNSTVVEVTELTLEFFLELGFGRSIRCWLKDWMSLTID